MSKKKKSSGSQFIAVRKLRYKDLVVLPGEPVPQAILANGQESLLTRGHIERATSFDEQSNTMSDSTFSDESLVVADEFGD